MAAEPKTMVLAYLRRIDENLDRLIDDVGELNVIITRIEDRLRRMAVDVRQKQVEGW